METRNDADAASTGSASGIASGLNFSLWKVLLFVGAVVAGIASIMQTTFNSGLAQLLNDVALSHPKSELVAMNFSFIVSTTFFCLAAAISQLVSVFHTADSEKNDEPAAKSREYSTGLMYFAYAATGLFGAMHGVLKVSTSPILGLGLDYLFVVLGQLVASLLIDWFGFLGVEPSRPTWPRFCAILLALAGAMMVTLSVAEFDKTNSVLVMFGATVLAFIAGVCHPVQAATMQVLRSRHPSPWIVALISFGVGLLWLTTISAVTISVGHVAGELEGNWPSAVIDGITVFDVLGGLFAAAFISLTIVITPVLGLNSFYIVSVFGQLLAGILVDAAPASVWKHALPTIAASPLRILGVSTSLIGIALLVVPSHWFEKYERLD